MAGQGAAPPILDLSLILRGIAAAGVVWWHVAGYAIGAFPALNVPGRVWVWIFFTLSGYVIAYGFLHGRYQFRRDDLARFYSNRVLRLMPLFWLISLVALAMAGVQGTQRAFGWAEIPAQFFALQWSHSYALSGVFWTLGIELQFYLLAPVVMLGLFRINAMRDRSRRLAFGVIYLLLLLYPAAVAQLAEVTVDNRTILGNLAHFLVGMLLAFHSARLDPAARRLGAGFGPIAIRAGGGTLCIMAAAWLYHEQISGFWSGLGALFTHAGMVLWLRVHVALEARGVVAGPIARVGMGLGVLSYGLYAWHDLVMRTAPSLADQVLAVMVLSLALAFASNRLVERPAQRLRFKARPVSA